MQGTPIRMRPNILAEKRQRTVNMSSASDGGVPSDGIPSPAVPGSDESGPQLVIWGTDVVVSTCKTKFKRFILMFIDYETEMDERTEDINSQEPLYLQKLKEVGFFLMLNGFIRI